MSIVPVVRNLACVGVTIVAAAQAAREAVPFSLPILGLGVVLAAALVARADPALRLLTPLGFVFCAVVATRFSIRIPLPLASDTVLYTAPAVLMIGTALGAQAIVWTRNRSTAPTVLSFTVFACGVAGVLGYLCLSRLYSLDGAVLHSLVLNCALLSGGWLVAAGSKPGRGLSYAVCAGLLFMGVSFVPRMILS